MNIEKMKPIFTKNKTDITFNELGQKLGHHPIIILYLEREDEYCYLKIRSARDDDGRFKKPNFNDVFLPANPNAKGILKNDSYVDPTKIYHIKRSELEKYVDPNNSHSIGSIDPIKGLDIYYEVLHNLNQKPPFCSIMKVSYDQNLNKFISKTEYAHEELLNHEWRLLQKKIEKESDEIKEKWSIEFENLKKTVHENAPNFFWPAWTNKQLCEDIACCISEESNYYWNDFFSLHEPLDAIYEKLQYQKIKVFKAASDPNRPYKIKNIIEFENFLKENNYIQYHTYQEMEKIREEQEEQAEKTKKSNSYER
ncbi:hypothetical protein MCAV_07370 [[Mycoplasma] cavipharyngis]|uniref:Mbov_0400 family ICE element protein n=1 Tax=[Mycoplasma] cavipharyngis TaxID=92757 RepID=UPI003703C8B8